MTETKIERNKAARLWERELEVIKREASRSEIVAFVKDVTQLWEREASRSEVVTFVTELVSQNKRLIERIKELTSIRDRFSSCLDNLVAETTGLEEDEGQTTVGVVKEDKPEVLTLFVPISEISDISINSEKESFEPEDNVESDLALLIGDHDQMIEEGTAIESAEYVTALTLPQGDSLLFDGEIEVVMAPPVDPVQLIRFRRNLQDTPQLKISRTSGSWNGGTIITVLIDKPLPLIDMLKEIPDVEKAELWAGEEATDDHLPGRLAFEFKPRSWPSERIIITLNHSEV